MQTSGRPLPVQDRAAQFMPFRALTGYEDAVLETARLTDEKLDPSDDEKALLDRKLQLLEDGSMTGREVTLTWFRPDKRKSGGAYATDSGTVRRVDRDQGEVVLVNGQRIPIADILDIHW